MKAAILKAFGSPLSIEQVPDPVIGTGEVLVEIAAVPLLPYANEVFSGERKYLLDLPIVPGLGAVGKILAKGPDATRLSVGEYVLCDPTIRSRDDARTPDITLHGWSARGEGGLQLQKYYHDGALAEQMMVPTENVFSLGQVKPEELAKWCTFCLTMVPYGGLLAINLQAGETVLISGATGNYGSAAVTVALAMGAGCVIAPGRNANMLEELKNRFGNRVRPVLLTGHEKTDTENMKKAAPGPIDCMLDILPPSAGTAPVRAALMTVREYGRVVLMGGVGMLGGDDLKLPYPWIMRNSITIKGQWMYPRHAVPQLIALGKSGLLPLDEYEITSFGLDRVNEAVDFSAHEKGRFRMTVIKP